MCNIMECSKHCCFIGLAVFYCYVLLLHFNIVYVILFLLHMQAMPYHMLLKELIWLEEISLPICLEFYMKEDTTSPQLVTIIFYTDVLFF